MEPYGKSLLAFLEGDTSAHVVVRRDDDAESILPAAWFFRDTRTFTTVEQKALALCKGRVLDIGCGAGALALELQQRSHRLTAIDVSADAVTVALRRGVADVICGDIFSYDGGPFDTLLMLGHGLGMVETTDGLRRFLLHAGELLATDGQLLVDSMDARVTQDQNNLAYQDANRAAGRYFGEIRMRFEYEERGGPWCGWLHIDADTLTEYAGAAGWRCGIIHHDPNGDYLARLTRARGAN